MKRTILSAFLALAACSDPDTGADTGTLDLTLGGTELSGSYQLDDTLLTFRGEELAPNVWVSRVEVNGMTLEATMDRTDGLIVTHDGYTTADGSDTQLLEEDRIVILMFVKKLEAEVPDIAHLGGAAQAFDEVVNKWAEWIPAMSLQAHEVHSLSRSGNLCYYAQAYGSYTGCNTERWVWLWHDCWTCEYDDRCTNNVQMGDHCGCGDDAWVWTGSTWECRDNDHAPGRRYAVGNCYGRYGEGCGSGTSYNWESGDHDNCVRNGHSLVSAWCSDELLSTHSDGNCY